MEGADFLLPGITLEVCEHQIGNDNARLGSRVLDEWNCHGALLDNNVERLVQERVHGPDRLRCRSHVGKAGVHARNVGQGRGVGGADLRRLWLVARRLRSELGHVGDGGARRSAPARARSRLCERRFRGSGLRLDGVASFLCRCVFILLRLHLGLGLGFWCLFRLWLCLWRGSGRLARRSRRLWLGGGCGSGRHGGAAASCSALGQLRNLLVELIGSVFLHIAEA